MKLARIERKRPKLDMFKANDLFKKCYEFRAKIIDFEFENTKFLMRKQNAHEAANWLKLQMAEVKTKCDRMYKEQRVLWLKERMYEKCQLLYIELQIKIDHRSPTIQS